MEARQPTCVAPDYPRHKLASVALTAWTANGACEGKQPGVAVAPFERLQFADHLSRRQERPRAAVGACDRYQRVAVRQKTDEWHAFRISRTYLYQGTTVPLPAAQRLEQIRHGPVPEARFDSRPQIGFDPPPAVLPATPEQELLTTLIVTENGGHLDDLGLGPIELPSGHEEWLQLCQPLLSFNLFLPFPADIVGHRRGPWNIDRTLAI